MVFYRLIRLPGYLVLSRGKDTFLSFDRQGRFFHGHFQGRTLRLGLDGRAVELLADGPAGIPSGRALPIYERDAFLENIRAFLDEVREVPKTYFEKEGEVFLHGPQALEEVQRMSCALSKEALHHQWEAFGRLYGRIPILPPDAYGSLFVQLTKGCASNACLFCELYKDRSFEVLSRDALEDHLEAVLEFQGRTLPRFKALFFGDANALAMTQEKLLERLDVVFRLLDRHKLSWLGKRWFSFIDAGPPNRTVGEFEQLKDSGLERIHLGLESGSWPLREALGKPQGADAIKKRIANLKEAGISLSVIVMSGIGGKKWAGKHMQETVDTLGQLPLDADDIVYVSPLRTEPDSKYSRWEKELGLGSLSEIEIREQANELTKTISASWKEKAPQTAIYDLGRFVY